LLYMVLANVVRELFQMVSNEYGADKDTQALVKLFERNAGVSHRTAQLTAARLRLSGDEKMNGGRNPPRACWRGVTIPQCGLTATFAKLRNVVLRSGPLGEHQGIRRFRRRKIGKER
jgi:hypothetical protein